MELGGQQWSISLRAEDQREGEGSSILQLLGFERENESIKNKK